MPQDDDLTVSEEEELNAAPPRRKTEQKPKKKKATPSRPTMWQTKVRESLTPYLPPPVIKAIQQTDPQLEAYFGPEASVTIFTTVLLAWLVVRILKSLTRSGPAYDQAEDAVLSTSTAKGGTQSYDTTVLLVGPSLSGKTRLFYRLCYGPDYGKMPTLVSLKANVGYATTEENATIRYMDWPGLASLDDPALTAVFRQPTRIVLVLDATQPVAAAADVLNHLLSIRTKDAIFIACHKSDFPKAKNWRRIKIQLRTELERLLKLSKGSDWWEAGKPLDMEALPLHFVSTTSEGKFSTELLDFCQTGKLPQES